MASLQVPLVIWIYAWDRWPLGENRIKVLTLTTCISSGKYGSTIRLPVFHPEPWCTSSLSPGQWHQDLSSALFAFKFLMSSVYLMSIHGNVNQPYTRAIAKMTCFFNNAVSILRQTLALPPSDLALAFSDGPILSRALQLACLCTYLDTNRSPILILPVFGP